MKKVLFILLFIFKGIFGISQIDDRLMKAVHSNDLVLVKGLVENGIDIHAVDENNANILMWAVAFGEAPLVKFLVEKEVNLYTRGVLYIKKNESKYIGNLTSIAAVFGKTSILKYLIEEKKIPVDDKAYNLTEKKKIGRTALQWAIEYGQFESIEYLLNQNAKITRGKALFMLASVYREEGNWLKALNLFQQFSKLLTKRYGEDNIIYGRSLDNLAELYLKLGNYEKALFIYEKKHNILEKELGTNSLEYKACLNQLWNIYFDVGYHEKALVFFQNTSIYIEKEFSENPLEYATYLGNLAELYFRLENYEESLPLFEQALEIIQKELGINDVRCKQILHALLDVCELSNNYEKSIFYHEQILAFIKNELGENHIEYSTYLINLANSYLGMENYEEALPLLEKALKIIEKEYGIKDIRYKEILQTFPGLCLLSKNYEKANFYHQQILSLIEKESGKNSIEYGRCLQKMAESYWEIEDYEKALTLYEKYLNIIEKELGINDSEYVNCLNVLWQMCQDIEDYEKALFYFQKTSVFFEKEFGKDGAGYATYLINLATLYSGLGNLEEALTLYVKAFEIIKKEFGVNDLRYKQGLQLLSGVCWQLKNYEESFSYYQQFLDIIEKELGGNHIEYGRSLQKMAELYLELDNYKDAIPLHINAIKIIGQAFKDNKDTSDSSVVAYLNYSLELTDIANFYRDKGYFSEALPFFTESLKLIEGMMGKKEMLYLNSLGNLIALYVEMGNRKAAEIYYKKALKIAKNLSKEKGYTNNLDLLADVHTKMGRYKRALPLRKQLIKITEKEVGKMHLKYGIQLNDLAILHRDMGNEKEALPIFQEALKTIENVEGITNTNYGLILINIASLYHDTGENDKAIAALAKIEKTLAVNNPNYNTISDFLIQLYQKLEEHGDAIPLIEKSLEITEKQQGKNNTDYSNRLNLLANAYQRLGSFEKALPLLNESIQITEDRYGKNHIEHGINLSKLAELYLGIGNYKESIRLFELSLQIFEKKLGVNNLIYTNTLMNLSIPYSKLKEIEAALPLLQKSIIFFKKEFGENHWLYGEALNKLAFLYYEMKYFDKAIPLFERAIELDIGDEESFAHASLLNNLANSYSGLKLNKKALPLYKSSLNIFKKVAGEDSYIYGYPLIAMAVAELDEPKEAISSIMKSLKNSKRQSARLPYLSEMNQKTFSKHTWINNQVYHSFAYLFPRESEELIKKSFNNNIHIKNQLLNNKKELLYLIQNSKNKEFIQKGNKWLELQAAIAHQNSKPVAIRINNLDSLNILASQVENELATSSREFRQIRKEITWQDLKENLKEGELILDIQNFSLFDEKGQTDSIFYTSYLITPAKDKIQQIVLFEENQIIEVLDSTSTNNLYTPRGAVKDGKKQKNLELIWKPLLPYLSKYNTIYISPSGLLNEVNLGAIPISKDSLAMDRFKIYQYGNLKSLVIEEEKPKKEKDFLLVGGINYDYQDATTVDTFSTETIASIDFNNYADVNIQKLRGEITTTWNFLSGTVEEVKKIGNLLDKEHKYLQIITGKAATEGTIKAILNQPISPSVVHIATHGFFFPDVEQKKEDFNLLGQDKIAFKYSDDPMIRSGLVLAGANDAWSNKLIPSGQEDGILTAKEVSNLNLRNTELVVLSACETGLGEQQGTEGVYGLQRAFKMAGAKNLLISLWSVSDKTTQELMTTFYTNWLEKKMSLRDAFDTAQQKMRKKYKDPALWAGFILIE